MPLVIEPLQSSSETFLVEFLRDHSKDILEDISNHGAVLIRGFDIRSPSSFEKTVLGISSMRGMNEILFQLPGRMRLVEDTRFVHETSVTSKLEKTGGNLAFHTFHTENYGFPDVPSYLAFYCVTASKLGGETGLVNLTKVYSQLNEKLKHRLEERACLVQLHSIAATARKHGVQKRDIVEFCKEANLPIEELQGKEYIAIFKPNVVQHKLTHERAVVVNFDWVPGLRDAVIDAFLKDYSGYRWWMHRFSWRSSSYKRYQRLKGRYSEFPGEDIYVFGQSPMADARSLSSVFSTDDVRVMAGLMRNSYSAFLWTAGDILLIDNLKTAHAGMPGSGARHLKVMMCNPVRFSARSQGAGLYVMSSEAEYEECMGSQLKRFANRNS